MPRTRILRNSNRAEDRSGQIGPRTRSTRSYRVTGGQNED